MRVALLLPTAALAAKPGPPPHPSNIVDDVPGLREALAAQGWEPTPVQSSACVAGDFLRSDGKGRLNAEKCFQDRSPRTGTRVDAAIVQKLRASGSVRLGLAKANWAAGSTGR